MNQTNIEKSEQKYVDEPNRNVLSAMINGAKQKCPCCGQGRLFRSFLKTNHACEVCSLEFHHHRADDAPPYFTIVIVGHFIVSAILTLEVAVKPPLWLHMLIWIPLSIVFSLILLGPIKGAIVGLQWSKFMHGFGLDPHPEDATNPLNSKIIE